MENVLITGGAGFIGSHTADALVKRGFNVRILDILDPQIHGERTDFPAYLNPAVEFIKGDVRVVADVNRALEGIDIVYHFAALTGVGQSMYDMRDYVDKNCTGTATVLESIVKSGVSIKRFILASSRAVYGEGTHHCADHGPIYPDMRSREEMERGVFEVFCPECGRKTRAMPTKEERPLLPLSVYAWTKRHQEEQCQYAATTFGLPVTILRYFNVYGSRQSLENPYTGVLSIFYSRIKAGKPIYVYENGAPGRDFVHISDVVQANILAQSSSVETGSCINVGTGTEITILEIANKLVSAVGRRAEILDHGEFRIGDIHSCYADLEKAQRVLGFRPRIAFSQGIEEFVSWAADQKAIDQYQKTVEELRRYHLFGRVGGDPQ